VRAWEEVEGYLRRENLRGEWVLKETGEARLENAESWRPVSSKDLRHIGGARSFGDWRGLT
jgi:hypothetical protein